MKGTVAREGVTMENCPLCGRVVDRGGYSVGVQGVRLGHLCRDCRELCSKDPKKVADQHRDVFERMLAERRDSLLRKPAAQATTTPASKQQEREQALFKRYDDAYAIAKSIIRVGDAIKTIGVILAILIVGAAMFVGLASGSEPRATAPSGTDLFVLAIGVVVGLIVGMVCYALGTLVAAMGQTLQAGLDTAVNTSPFLDNELRARAMFLDQG